MQDRSINIKNAFREAVGQCVEVIERIPPDAWDKPGLGAWTIRELVAHTLRVIEGTTAYAGESTPVDTARAADYYIRAMSTPRVHEQIAERAREGAALLGGDPAQAARTVANRTLAALDALDDAAAMTTPFGTLRLVDYLPARILEIVVHTLDIGHAAEVPVEPSPDALTVTLALLGELAVKRGEGIALALALSGRRSLPDGFNVLG